ncbi:MAG: WD40 repeat domain-containing protein, partial [Phycisphaerae bacterium]
MKKLSWLRHAFELAVLLFASLAYASENTRAVDPQRASYQAHIAAAKYALDHRDAAAAKRWLDQAPMSLRGWEWRLLKGCNDQSRTAWTIPGGAIYALDLSPDGKRLAAASHDGHLRIINAETGNIIREIAAHSAEMYGVRFSKDGKWLGSASRDTTAKIWNAETYEVVTTFTQHKAPVTAIIFNEDTTEAATCNYRLEANDAGQQVRGTVYRWNPQTGALVDLHHTLTGGVKPISAIEFSPEEQTLVAGSWGGAAWAWNLADSSEPRELTIPDEGLYTAVNDVAFSTNGQWIVAGAKDRTARIWNADSGTLVVTLRGHDGDVMATEFQPHGTLLATGSSDGTIRLWTDKEGWKAAAALLGHTSGVLALEWSNDGARLFSADQSGVIRTWLAAPETFAPLLLQYPRTAIYTSLFDPSGDLIAGAAYDGFVAIWDSKTGALVREWDAHHEASCNTLSYSADGMKLLTCSWDKTAKFWNPRTAELLATLAHEVGVYHCALSPDGTVAATVPRGAGKHEILIWSLEDEKIVHTLSGHTQAIHRIVFSSEGTTLASASSD